MTPVGLDVLKERIRRLERAVHACAVACLNGRGLLNLREGEPEILQARLEAAMWELSQLEETYGPLL